MKILESLRTKFSDMESRTQLNYFATFAMGLLLINLGIAFYGKHIANKTLKDISNINKMRRQAKTILQKNILVEQKKREVESILTEDPSFKIKEFFDGTLEEVQLSKKSTKEPEVGSPRNLNNGYSEIKLEASFSEITMQDITELLLALEKNPRIFTKDLVMSRNKTNGKTLDATVTIATLQPTTT